MSAEFDSIIKRIRFDLERQFVDGSVSPLSRSKTDMLTYDVLQGREVNYHLTPPAADWLLSILTVAPDVKDPELNGFGGRSAVAELLLTQGPAMFINLRHIIVTTESEADADFIADRLEIEPYEVCAYQDSVGMFWFDQSAVIINIQAIDEAIADLVKELHLSDLEHEEERVIGFYSTLYHELRHLGLENPFLPEDLYPTLLNGEDAVESYAREQTDRLLPRLRKLANDVYETKNRQNKEETS